MKTVVGLFDSFTEAQSTVKDLTDAGFDRNRISVVANDAAKEYASYDDTDMDHDNDGAAAGAIGGTVVGGTLGVLAGLGALGALVIPGVGPVIAAGPLLAGAAGAGIGALTGGLLGALADAGIPDNDASYYAEGVRRGGTLVMVEAEDDAADDAADILDRHNAVDVDERSSSWRERGWTGYDNGAPAYTTDEITTDRNYYNATNANYDDSMNTGGMTGSSTTPNDANFASDSNNYTRTGSYADTDMDSDMTATSMPRNTDMSRTTDATMRSDSGEEVRLPIVQEELRVGKREVQGGGVRLYSRVTQEPVQEDVTLRDERVTVDRRPVDRAATEADFDAFREGEIELTETSEEAVVDKQARVVEEVVARKEVDSHTETVRDSVRRTDVEVENLSGSNARMTGMTNTTMGNAYDAEFYRGDYDTNYTNSGYTYEQYEPAYRYGYTLASDDRYTDRDWTSVEGDVRNRWEESNPGTWEKFKNAVRRAWDDVRGR